MATVANATKKLERAGFEARRYDGDRAFYFYKSAHGRTEVVSFYEQNGEAICINVRDSRDRDDLITDYFAGSYVRNIAQAIRLAQSSLDRAEQNERDLAEARERAYREQLIRSARI